MFAIALYDNGRILIGGTFTSYNGLAVGRIALINANGTIDDLSNSHRNEAGFNQMGSGTGFTGATDSVLAIAVQHGAHPSGEHRILIGGRFTRYNGVNSVPDNLLGVDIDGVYDNTFVPPAFSGSATGSTTHVRAIAVQPDDKVIVAGDWTSTGNGNPYRRVARLTADGPRDAAYSSADALQGITSGNKVNALAVQTDEKIIIAGDFSAYNSVQAFNIVRVNTDGSRDATFSSGAGNGTTGSINQVAVLPDGDILIGGDFTTNGSPTRMKLARLNADGSVDNAFDAGSINGAVTAMCIQPDGKVLIGGYFTTINGTTVNRLARLNNDGSLDASFNQGTGANAVIRDIAITHNGKFFAAGTFTGYNQTTCNRLVKVNNIASPYMLRNAMAFDGVDDFITVSHHHDFDVSEFRFEAWIRSPSTINPGTYTLFSKEGATIDYRISLVSTTAGSFSTISLASDVFGNMNSATVLILPDEWHHINVGIYDLGNGSSQVAFGVDGKTPGWFVIPTVAGASNNYPIRIGSANATNFFCGEMDEVKFWASGSGAMVRNWKHLEFTTGDYSYSSGEGLYLAGYWQFNQNESNFIEDYSIWINQNLNNRSNFSYKNGTPSAGLSAGYIRQTSAPVGSIGAFMQKSVNVVGNLDFTGTDCQLNFPVANSGYYVVTHIEHAPAGTRPNNAQIPGLLAASDDEYWIVDNYTSVNAGLNVSMTLAGITGLNNSDPALYVAKRSSNSHANWTLGSDPATNINSATGTATFPGINSFSQFVPVSLGSSPLPVDLLSFDAERSQAGVVLLRWQTASEHNNHSFELQRSPDGMKFGGIANVKGHGTTQEKQTYTFTDGEAPLGKVYYRLKQVDFDGKHEYSIVRFVAPAQDKMLFPLYPNPAHTGEIVYLEEETNVEVINSLQQRVMRDHTRLLDTSGWAPGIYVVVDREKQRAVKLIISQ